MTVNHTASRWLALGLLALAGSAGATTITVINNDGAGEGFNDPAVPPAAAGCQPGDTLGACRLRVFQTAADQWELLLNSTVTIQVRAAMDPQQCQQTSAVLGSAGSLSSHSNFTNAPRANIAYPQALANSYAGSDLNAATPDIQATFNISLDTGTCLNGTAGWWYNTDPSVPIPNDRTPLLPVVFHEIGHGLGFSSGVNTATGAFTTGTTPSIWGVYLYDVETGKYWRNMTNAERIASSINDPDLVWTGPRTNKLSVKYVGLPAKVTVNAPAGIAGTYDAQTAEFGASVATSPVTADVVLVDDGVVGTGTINDGCETPFVNAAAVAGKIALIDRGICTFAVKVKNAQLNGAIGVIVANNVAAGFPSMAGADATITIPSLGVTQATGTAIKANLAAPVNAKLGQVSSGPLSGTNSGCVRMFAPNPLQSGSSVSHFHSDAFPNLLMEPALNRSIFNKVDLTLPLFADIDWSTNIEDIVFFDGLDPNPCQFVTP
jgi:PA domain